MNPWLTRKPLAGAIGLICLSVLSIVASASAQVPAAPVIPAQERQPGPHGRTASEISGVDLSKWQGEVDFPAIKAAGRSYVFIKATQGAREVDPNYRRNISDARKAGLAAGSYHFYMTNESPEAQFVHMSTNVSLLTGDLPPVVDIELLSRNTLQKPASELKLFLSLLEKKYRVKPIVYSGESFANEYLAGFSGFPLWLAEYNKDRAPKLPLDWKRWTFWQHTQSGTVPGVSGKVDLDRFNGTRRQFRALLVRFSGNGRSRSSAESG